MALFFKVVPYSCILCADVCPRSWYIIYDKQVKPVLSSVTLNGYFFKITMLHELFGID